MAELSSKDFERIRDIDRKFIELKREADCLSSGIDKLRAELKMSPLWKKRISLTCTSTLNLIS